MQSMKRLGLSAMSLIQDYEDGAGLSQGDFEELLCDIIDELERVTSLASVELDLVTR